MCAARSDLTPLAHLSLPSAIPDYALNQLERSRKFGCYEGKEQEGDENPLDQLITMPEEMCCRVAQALKCISGSIHSEPEGLGVYKRSKEFLSNFFYRVIDTLYRPAAVSLDIPIKEMVSGRVSADGFGDLFHILRVYEIIKRTFPHWNLLVVCDVIVLV